jgi:hypothetical protein
MERKRQTLWILLTCIVIAASVAFAQSTLTQIRDTINGADGSPFNGTVVITWNGPTGPTAGAAPLSTSARVYNGALSVLLVPNSSSASSFYQVFYYNTNGLVMWSETWQVPNSSTPLTVAAVRGTSTGGGGQTGSGGGTGTGGGTGSSGGSPNSGQYATLPISINQVTSLSANLASINYTLAMLASQMNGLSASSIAVSTGNTNFVDAESPVGTLNGSNTAFTLAQAPSSGSLAIYRNGLLQSIGVDYTLNGASVTFLPTSVPRATDVLTAFYRVPGPPTTVVFVDSETPSGTMDGSNLSFTLNATPSPATSIKLYKNGVFLTKGSDYSLNGNTITFANTTVTPQNGDVVTASYRR